MKSVPLFCVGHNQIETVAGKLWVRPAVENRKVHEAGGLIEIALHLLPLDGKLYAKALVDCREFKDRYQELVFASQEAAQAFQQGLEAADPTSDYTMTYKNNQYYVLYRTGR